MKKLFITALLAVTVAAGVFAKAPININAFAANSFKFAFKKATNVSWTTVNEFARVSFTLNNEKMSAYYNAEGEMIATSKIITLDELPVNAKRTAAKKCEGYTVKEAICFEASGDTAYCISAENNKEAVILKVSDSSGLLTCQIIKK